VSRAWRIAHLTTLLAACGAPTPQVAPLPKPAAPVASPPAPCAEQTTAAKPPQDADLEPIEGLPITAICFRGVSPDVGRELARYLRMQDGSTFTRAQASADFNSLWKSMLIDDLRVTARPAGPRAIILDYDVKMRPRITEVTFHGATALGDAALAQSFPFHEDSVLSAVGLRRALHELEGVYQERGYPNVHTTYSVEPISPAAVRVRIDVAEGPLVRVQKLAFSGLQKVKQPELQNVLKQRIGDPYSAERTERDVLLVVEALHDRGLIEAKIDPRATIVGDAATITFDVTEGRTFKVAKLHMTGEPLGVERDLLASLATKPGAVFRRSLVMQDIKALQRVAVRKGLAVEISPESDVDLKAQTVSLAFRVDVQPR
jgi:outer membrane protein insertion porin family